MNYILFNPPKSSLTFDQTKSSSPRHLTTISHRTIIANQKIQKDLEKYTIVSKKHHLSSSTGGHRKSKKHRKSDFLYHPERYNAGEMIDKTKKGLRKVKFVLQTLIDDGRSTLLLKKFKMAEVFIMPKNTVIW
jgi:hypothetical protein